ncbi:hypothetical protein BDY19DRAFT_937855 [Irpex rosettiformis]|uniref:Uncharacterized protein n=1 Tax=Irpex rosettiformis TaxID=378272 RepID=A0ACB8U9C0_9APHY|nr:hypothetical protein BDY19DRAFT_937855 [Irpex rosettiformis]
MTSFCFSIFLHQNVCRWSKLPTRGHGPNGAWRICEFVVVIFRSPSADPIYISPARLVEHITMEYVHSTWYSTFTPYKRCKHVLNMDPTRGRPRVSDFASENRYLIRRTGHQIQHHHRVSRCNEDRRSHRFRSLAKRRVYVLARRLTDPRNIANLNLVTKHTWEACYGYAAHGPKYPCAVPKEREGGEAVSSDTRLNDNRNSQKVLHRVWFHDREIKAAAVPCSPTSRLVITHSG